MKEKLKAKFITLLNAYKQEIQFKHLIFCFLIFPIAQNEYI